MIDFEKMKKFRNEQKAFIKYIGFQILDIKEDYAQGEVVLREIHGNPIGSVHGGVLFSIADTIGGVAASSSAGSSVNLAGLPGISVPCGYDGKGLPIGLQLIGDCFKEKNIIRAAYTFEQTHKYQRCPLAEM